MQAYVIVATKGRPKEVARLVADLKNQTLPPAGVVVVGTNAADVGLVDTTWANEKIKVVMATEPGLTRQRNTGIDIVLNSPGREADDLVCFFDDDFRPAPDWLEQAAAAFAAFPDALALGGDLLLNENDTAEERAERLIAADMAERAKSGPGDIVYGEGLYGCNMAVRSEALKDIRFDEGLPLYSWLEDADFSIRIRRAGTIIHARTCRGVHLNTAGGRIAGVRFGYSQVANPIYLTRRGSMPAAVTLKLVTQAILANGYRSVARRPGVDHPGRLRGNLIALADFARNRVFPERIKTLAS